jgi:hypothetical protein
MFLEAKKNAHTKLIIRFVFFKLQINDRLSDNLKLFLLK